MKTDFISAAGRQPGLPRCVQRVPATPVMVEFVGQTHVRAFPIAGLNHYVLQPNPEFRGDFRTPPDKLTFEFSAARMTLLGWRLDLLAEAFRLGQVARVRVMPEPRYKSRLKHTHVSAMWIHEFKQG